MTIEEINVQVQAARKEVFGKSEEPTAEELAAMDAELQEDILEAEENQARAAEEEVASDEAAADAEGITYEEYVDNKEAGVYDTLAALDAENNASVVANDGNPDKTLVDGNTTDSSAKEDDNMLEEMKTLGWIEDINFDAIRELRVSMNVPQDPEKRRKAIVYSAEARMRIAHLSITIEQTGATARRRAARMGYKHLPALYETVSALVKIDTLYAGYAHERLLAAKYMHVGRVKLRDANKAATWVDLGTREIISVSFDGIGDNALVRAIVPNVINYGLWIIENVACAGGFAVVYRDEKGEYFSLNNQITGLNKPWQMDKWLRDGSARHYVCFIDSPSGYRQGMMPMIYIPWQEEEDLFIQSEEPANPYAEYIQDILNCATGGMYKVEQTANGGKLLRVDKGIKLVGRESLGVTPSTFFGYVKNLAIFLGKFGFSNGNSYVSVQTIQEMAEKKLGFPISLLEAYKFGGQHRINSFWKGHNQIVDREAILTIIEDLIARGIIKGVIHLNNTLEDSIKFAKMMNDPEYEGYLVVFGLLARVDCFGDLDDVKCSTDFSQPLELRLMDISHTPKGFIPLSKQGIVQMQLTGDPFIEMYKTVAPASLDRTFKGVEFDDVDEGLDEATDMDVSVDKYILSAVQRLCPQAMQFDMHIRRMAISSVADTLNNRLNRLNLTVSGQYLKIVPDFGGYVDTALLAGDEFYSPRWKTQVGGSEDDGTGFDAVIIRYPLVDFGAFIKGRAVSKDEMVRRIFALNVSTKVKQALLNILESITPAMVMIASMVPGTTDKLSGADFDGDGVSLQSDLAVKKVYQNLKSYSNNFGSSRPGNKEVEFDYKLGPISFLYAWALDEDSKGREPNPAIGIVAGQNVTTSSALAMLYLGKLTKEQIFHKFLDYYVEDEKGNLVLIKAKPGKNPYNRLFTADGSNDLGVDVSFEGREDSYVEDFVNAAYECDWSFESCVRFLWDYNAVLSKSMNDVIDAAKNGAVVVVPFLKVTHDRIRSSCVATKDYARIEMSRSELKIASYTPPCGSESSKRDQQKSGMLLMVNDPVGIMKRRIFALAKDRLEKALDCDIKTDIQEASGGKMLDGSVALACEFFQDLMKAQSNDKPAAKRHVLNMTYSMIVEDCGITDPEQILGILLKASKYTKEGEDGVVHYSSFYAQFAELLHHYVSKFNKDMRFEKRVYGFKDAEAYVGKKVTFENGFSTDGFYVDERINGTFCLEADEKNRPIISKRVLDMIPQNKGDNKVVVMRMWKAFFEKEDTSKICVDPTFDVTKRMEMIEQFRECDNFKFEVKLYNPVTQQFATEELSKLQVKDYVPMLMTNIIGKSGKPCRLGFIKRPGGNSVYLQRIMNRQFTIKNVMKMGKDLETICIVAEEVA